MNKLVWTALNLTNNKVPGSTKNKQAQFIIRCTWKPWFHGLLPERQYIRLLQTESVGKEIFKVKWSEFIQKKPSQIYKKLSDMNEFKLNYYRTFVCQKFWDHKNI